MRPVGWKDKAAATIFAVATLIALATIGYITVQSRDDAPASAASAAPRDERVVRGLVLDYARAVQRGDPEGACILMGGDAYAAFDCRFGRTDVPAELALPKGRELAVGEVVVQGDQALAQLRGGATPQPVRLTRTGRRWKIVRVGLPRQN